MKHNKNKNNNIIIIIAFVFLLLSIITTTTTIEAFKSASTASTSASASASTSTFYEAATSMPWTPMIDTELRVLSGTEISNVSDYDTIVVVVPENTTHVTQLSNKTRQMSRLLFDQNDKNDDDINDNDDDDAAMENMLLLLKKKKTPALVSLSSSSSSSSSSSKNAAAAAAAAAGPSRAVSVLVLEVPAGDDGTKLGATLASKFKTDEEQPSKNVLVLLPTSNLNLTSSMLAGLYSDKRYKGRTGDDDDDGDDNDKTGIETIHFIIDDNDNNIDNTVNHFQTNLDLGTKLAKGIYLTKDIVNAPHNSLNSLGLAEVAKRIAAESGGTITCKILSYQECEKRGMGAFLGVARGAETLPQFIHLTYKKPSKRRWGVKQTPRPLKKVGIVGKGLLMDTGGYNIKTSMMELMKFDCGGAASVLGAALAISKLQPEGVEAHFVVAACENMINERAIVPGDVLTASNGKTIEVINTDAEGRLTMADALVYCDQEIGCERIIELSTLTGACMGALGTSMAGLFTEDDALAKELLDAADTTNDKLWRLPMEQDYAEQIRSKIADLRNLGQGRLAGAITAALFLGHFVEEGTPFAHIDMAGPVWNTKAGGATGWGTQLVTEWVSRQGRL